MKTLALYSIKGGVGKTAAAVNLSYLAAKSSLRTLLVDLDPQGSASYYFRMQAQKGFGKKALIKGGAKLEEGVRGSDYEGLDLIPSSLSFRNLDIALDAMKSSSRRLKKSLRQFEGKYDLAVLDCPPNLTLLSENVFKAADLILHPLIPTSLSAMSYGKLTDFFAASGFKLSKLRPFLSMVESRKRLHAEMAQNMADNDSSLLSAQIPYASEVERMGIKRMPLCAETRKSKAADAYRALWDEVMDILFKGRR